MRILITGSEGSLMQAVIPHLLDAGHHVRGVDNFVRYGRIERARPYEFVEGDLTDPGVADAVLDGVDGVIQAAARIYGIGGFHRYPADILAHDITLHQNVLWACLRRGIEKVAYVSSSMVFERCQKHPCAEDDVFDSLIPLTDYGLSKLVGERLCMAFAKQYGLKYVVWRPFNIITPHEQAEQEQGISHVFADFIGNIVHRRRNPLPIIGDGEQVRCFTWIDDVARAIAEHSFTPVTDNRGYNLGNPEPVSMKELARMIYEESMVMGLLPRTDRPLEFASTGSFPDDVRVRIPGVARAAAEIGWRPSVRTRPAVRRCLEELTVQAEAR